MMPTVPVYGCHIWEDRTYFMQLNVNVPLNRIQPWQWSCIRSVYFHFDLLVDAKNSEFLKKIFPNCKSQKIQSRKR